MKNKIMDVDFDMNKAALVQINKKYLEKEGILEDYYSLRGNVEFDEDGFDYIYIHQARLLGIIQ